MYQEILKGSHSIFSCKVDIKMEIEKAQKSQQFFRTKKKILFALDLRRYLKFFIKAESFLIRSKIHLH